MFNTTGQCKTYSIFWPFTQHLMSSMAKPNASHCWWKGDFFFLSSYIGVEVPCLLVPTLAQSPCNGLHCPTSFGRVGWQPYNVPLVIRVVNFQHWCGMYYTMPCIIQGLLCACLLLFPCGWMRNGVVHFVRSMWVTFNIGWQFQFLCGETKQLCALQVTNPWC